MKRPHRPVSPGEILRDEMEARMWTEKVLADKSDIVLKDVSRVINGTKAITPPIALLLSNAIGTTTDFWLNLQAAYERDLE